MILVRPDARLRAVVRASAPLLYRQGADPAQDRPGHVRAGSGLCWIAGRLVVVQDDAAFLALIDPTSGGVDAVPLPVDDGVRLWDDGRGNKHLKPDLEACVALDDATLLAFGSGSTPMRERVLVVTGLGGAKPSARWVECRSLYAALRAASAFSGSEMNIEAAALSGRVLRLFNRGNGAPRGGIEPVDASCELDVGSLRACLGDPAAKPPAPAGIVQYDLGEMENGRLGFTDATAIPAGVLFSAAAESSPDTYHDGPVLGCAIGYLGDEGGAWAPLLTLAGEPFTGKIEGITPFADREDRLWAVLDRDDPSLPSDLCEIELSGPWPAQR